MELALSNKDIFDEASHHWHCQYGCYQTKEMEHIGLLLQEVTKVEYRACKK
jgi:hypothetical protein